MGLPGRINTKRLIEHLNNTLEGQKQLVIFIDEFGKALEYIARIKHLLTYIFATTCRVGEWSRKLSLSNYDTSIKTLPLTVKKLIKVKGKNGKKLKVDTETSFLTSP